MATTNANPTILNVSDLPTRLKSSQPSSSGPSTTWGESLLPDVIRPWSADPGHDPFAPDEDGGSGGADVVAIDDIDEIDEIDEQEIYDLISTISDPEHPLSLGSLAVVSLPDIQVSPPPHPRSPISTVTVLITPTITHCSLATVIGLGVRVRLEQALPPRMRVVVKIKEGSHSTAEQVTKQLNDRERVAAALENDTLMAVLKKMLESCR
ncbi:MAG: hypothetical protein M1826_005855 [Phylliscum demangeonii]|nr:MAG: hypothetical protein M1826_005855 [Phylliscum demangeonii]